MAVHYHGSLLPDRTDMAGLDAERHAFETERLKSYETVWRENLPDRITSRFPGMPAAAVETLKVNLFRSWMATAGNIHVYSDTPPWVPLALIGTPWSAWLALPGGSAPDRCERVFLAAAEFLGEEEGKRYDEDGAVSAWVIRHQERAVMEWILYHGARRNAVGRREWALVFDKAEERFLELVDYPADQYFEDQDLVWDL
ncbi:hypothetical protein ACFC1T_09255 [Kitasatospora sp. NPDC056076]|uniref:hypothetical protein n=1 Tax=Kitasatospora sp. NPDC056076 TaxID=3345703 RepID=UPI0035DB340D